MKVIDVPQSGKSTRAKILCFHAISNPPTNQPRKSNIIIPANSFGNLTTPNRTFRFSYITLTCQNKVAKLTTEYLTTAMSPETNIAHRQIGQPDHLLTDHLLAVAKLAESFAGKFDAGSLAYALGLAPTPNNSTAEN